MSDVHLGQQDIELTRIRHQFQRFREDDFRFIDHPCVQWIGGVQKVGKAFLQGSHDLIRHRRKFKSGGLRGISEHAALPSGFRDHSEPHTRGPLGLPQNFQRLHEGRGVGYFDPSVVMNEVGECNARTDHRPGVSQRGLRCDARTTDLQAHHGLARFRAGAQPVGECFRPAHRLDEKSDGFGLRILGQTHQQIGGVSIPFRPGGEDRAKSDPRTAVHHGVRDRARLGDHRDVSASKRLRYVRDVHGPSVGDGHAHAIRPENRRVVGVGEFQDGRDRVRRVGAGFGAEPREDESPNPELQGLAHHVHDRLMPDQYERAVRYFR